MVKELDSLVWPYQHTLKERPDHVEQVKGSRHGIKSSIQPQSSLKVAASEAALEDATGA